MVLEVGRGGALERFDGSFRKDQTSQNKSKYVRAIKPTYAPHISIFYTLHSHTYTCTYTHAHLH